MAVSVSAGIKIYIGPVVDVEAIKALSYNDALTAFEAVSGGDWDEIGEVETIDRIGDTTDTATFTALGDRRARTFKTTKSGGVITVTCGLDPLDDGQVAMQAAQGTDFNYRFKIEYNDARDEEHSISTDYWAGQVMSRDKTIGSVTDISKIAFTISNNSGLIEDPTDPTGS